MERKVYFLQGHGEKDPTSTERDGYSAIGDALQRDNYKVDRLVLAQTKDVPGRRDGRARRRARPPICCRRGRRAAALPRQGGQADGACSIRRSTPRPRRCRISRRSLKEWGIDAGNNVVVDISGATNEPSIAVAATYPHARHHRALRDAHGVSRSRARSTRSTGGTNGRIAQPHRPDEPAQLGGSQPGVADRATPASRWTRQAATRPVRSPIAVGGVGAGRSAGRRRPSHAGDRARRRSPRRASSCSATPTSPATPTAA